ncbi:tetratricopeptide repeat protein [Streptomyces sp. NPDC059248]|uniref:tetratricopeptide repeat protein n=1 Tax=Streptomyces sp. NPDC059248 TaxID=3346791 RepID=UPI0036741CB4
MQVPSSDQLVAALSTMGVRGSASESSARHGLEQIVVAAALVDPAVRRLYASLDRTAQTAVAADWRELAEALVRLARQDTATRTALRDWLVLHAPPPLPPAAAPPSDGTSNAIGGNSVLHGPSVQARDIHGGLHFHSTAAAARTTMPIPRQLPPVPARFLDRESDRQALDTLRARRSPHAPQVLVVSGPPGVGKTTFATQWLVEREGLFPDGQLYADLGGPDAAGEAGPASPATVLEAFLIALGAPAVPVGVAQRSALWRSMTAKLRLVVLLDSAFTAAQVRPLLLTAPTGLTMVTSRSHLTGLQVDGAAVHRLDGLPAESAVELLAVGGGTRVSEEPAAAREVVRLCGRLPLAVALASAQLAVRPHRSVSALADSLSRGRGVLDALRVDGVAVMRTALDLSYELLPESSARLYRRMGLLPTDRHDLAMLTAIATSEERESEGDDAADLAVHALVEANLLVETAPSTYRFHDLVQPHARRLGEKSDEPHEREQTMRRFVGWCLSTAASAELLLTPSHRLAGHDAGIGHVPPAPLRSPEAALEWLDTHRKALIGAVRHCAKAGWHNSCWRLTDLMWPLFLRLRPTEMWIEAHRLGRAAAQADGSGPGLSRMLTSGAIGLRNAGCYDEAADWYRQALELATADGDVRQQSQAFNGLGHINLLAERLDEARTHFEQALRLRESIGYHRGAALSRRRLGETALASGDLDAAVSHLQDSANELAALDEGYEAARAHALLGRALKRRGDFDAAVRRLQDALNHFRSGSGRSEHWEARCLEWLGQVAQSGGDLVDAARLYGAARDILRRLSPEDAERLDDRLRQL